MINEPNSRGQVARSGMWSGPGTRLHRRPGGARSSRLHRL